MALNKLKFNSINVTPVANQAIKFNSSANGFETGSAGGAMTVIKKITASGSSTISFVDGSSSVVLDNTYKEYLFILNNIHNSEADRNIFVNFSADTGSNYNVTKTTTFFEAYHSEDNNTVSGPSYHTGKDLAQSTSAQQLMNGIKGDDDSCGVGFVHLFNPSSTTFVKHFMATTNIMQDNTHSQFAKVAGYCNTTSAIDAVQFSVNSGNIDSGTITLYGIN